MKARPVFGRTVRKILGGPSATMPTDTGARAPARPISEMTPPHSDGRSVAAGKARRAKGDGAIDRVKGKWRVRVVVDGTTRSWILPTKAEARAKLQEVKRDRARGTLTVRHESHEAEVTLGEWVDEWLRNHGTAHPRSLDGYRRRMKSVVGHLDRQMPLSRVQGSMLQRAFVGMRERGNTGTTMRCAWHAAHLCFAVAVRRGLITENPIDEVPRSAKDTMERTTLTREELQRLFAVARPRHNGAIVIVAGATGARVGELLALTWRDVDFDAGLMKITKSMYEPDSQPVVVGPPKTPRSRRTLPLSP
jgi:integrase